ncbi:MAG TPA: NADH-quinone oxidoreductase subunit J [Vicinamibacterales bacterium]|jgi:NADH-quinone oxidoreductase subunit J|nr:NADH-quinone oxidoreductase subunit J [Vicinamibacterales bacterium]
MAETLIFYVLSAVAILASVLVIGQRNPMYSVLMLVLSFAAVAGLFIQLDAPFLAVALMIVYAGAIMVLFLFVVMLLNAATEDHASWDQTHPLRHPAVTRFGTVFALLLVLELAYALLRGNDLNQPVGSQATPQVVGSVRELGRVLFTDYVFAFEATSLLILVAMVGAVTMARREGEQR